SRSPATGARWWLRAVIQPSYRLRYLTIVNKNTFDRNFELKSDGRSRKIFVDAEIFRTAGDRRNSRVATFAGNAQRTRPHFIAVVSAGARERHHGRGRARARAELCAELRMQVRISPRHP